MNHCFIIENVDYIDCILMDGIDWEDNDLDSEDSGRLLNGEMTRTVITSKRKLTVKLCPLTTEQYSRFSKAIRKPFIDVTFLDPIDGAQVEKTFYGSSIKATSATNVIDDEVYWKNGEFSIVMK